MVENIPPRRPLYSRAHASARTPDDRERRTQARREAEALSAPKSPVTDKLVAASPKQARVSPAAPAPEQHKTTEAAVEPARAIPAAHIPRIRTWVKYGMTIAQVAAAYGVDPGEIERLLGKA